MGKSRTSPLQQTGSAIGIGGSIGGGGLGTISGSGNSAGFAQELQNLYMVQMNTQLKKSKKHK